MTGSQATIAPLLTWIRGIAGRSGRLPDQRDRQRARSEDREH
jgi:hypothetical protein